MYFVLYCLKNKLFCIKDPRYSITKITILFYKVQDNKKYKIWYTHTNKGILSHKSKVCTFVYFLKIQGIILY